MSGVIRPIQPPVGEEEEEEEEHNGSNGPLKREFCLIVDENVLRSLVDAPEPVVQRGVGDEEEVAGNQVGNPGYVKVVDQLFDTTEELASRDREDYTGWMKASLDCLWMLYDLAEMELECPYQNEETGEFPVWDGGLPRREPYPPLGGIRPTDEEDDDDNDNSPPRGTQRGGTGQGTQRGPAASTIGGTQRGPPGGVQRPRPQLGPGDHPYNPNIRNQRLTQELIAAGQAAAAKLRERENEKKRKMEEAEEKAQKAQKAGKSDDEAAST